MDPLLRALASPHDGLFLSREAYACGYESWDLSGLVERGQLVRVRHGAYVESERWARADAADRHRLLTRAVLRYVDGEVASHVSGAIAHHVDMLDPDLTYVHTTYLDDSHGSKGHGTHRHRGPLDADSCVVVDNIPCAPADVCVAGAMLGMTSLQAVACGDSALHKGVTDQQSLARLASEWKLYPGSRKLRYAVTLLDPGAESIPESVLRFGVVARGAPGPCTQYTIRDRDGAFVARVDLCWPEHGVIVEFDGKQKYRDAVLRAQREGRDVAQVLIDEKLREDRLRALGWTVLRLTWADLRDLDRVTARVLEAIRTTAAPPTQPAA